MRLMITRISRYLSFIACLACFSAGSGFAIEANPDSDKKALSIDTALSLALANNKDLKLAGKAVLIAQAQLAQDVADYWLPQLSISGSAGYSYNGTAVTSQELTGENALPNNLSAGVSASKTIFAGWSYGNRIKTRENNLALARFLLEAKIREVKAGTLSAFYNVLLLESALDAAIVADRNLKKHLEYAEASFASGVGTRIEMLQAAVIYRTNAAVLERAKNELERAVETLGNTMGSDRKDKINAKGDLSDLEHVTWNEQDEAKTAELLIAHDTELASGNMLLSNARLSRETAELSRLPSISADASCRFNFSRNPFYTGSRDFAATWSIGLGISLPLDDLLPFSKTANLILEQTETEGQIELGRLSRIDAIMLSSKTYMGQLREYKASMEAANETLSLEEERLAQAEELSKKGLSNPLEIEDSRLSRREAELLRDQALYSYASLVWQLEYLTGEIDSWYDKTRNVGAQE